MTDVAARLTAALADRYIIERELGQGGMATVFLAEDVRHRRKVAVKVVHPELAAVLGAERFLSEIHVTAALQHPHILPLFDSGQADGQLFYVMPYVEGESLRSRLDREHQLPIDEAVRLAREVASALDYAHRHGVIHRDIKPENILLHDGQAVVADFGIALAVTNAGGGRLTQTGLSLGTPQYMSPEQATGERDIDARSDVYSLGAVTYEMLTGDPPFTGPTAQAIVAKVITTDPPRLMTQRKSIPESVEFAVLKALDKMPADRYASAAEFSKALTDSSGSFARTESRTTAGTLARTDKRWKVAAIALAAASVVLAAIVGWQATREPPSAPVSRYSINFEQNAISSGSDAPGISPDGSKFIYTDEEGRMLLRHRNQLQPVILTGGDNGWAPFFSPDGNSLALFTGFPGSLKVVPTAGGPARVVFADSALAHGGSWGDDGWLYFVGKFGGRPSLLRVRPEGGKPELVAAPDTARGDLFFFWPDVLPGGRAVLVTVWPQRGEPGVVAVETSNGKSHALGPGVRAMYAGSGILTVIQSDGSVTAVDFDPRALSTSGQPRKVLDGIRTGGQGRVVAALSRGGSLLYEAYQPVHQVVRVDRAGNIEPIDESWTGVFSHLAISPDGSHLAVSSEKNARTEVWSRDLVSGSLTRLASEGTYSYRPFWSADGQRVFFSTDRLVNPSLYSVVADGSSPPQVAKENSRAIDEGQISADGKWLIHRVGSGSGRDIYVSAVEGDTAARPLVNDEAEEYSPALSPDGRWLAYGATSTDRSEIYVRPFPDTRRARWQVSRNGGTEPVWSPDGRELFYRNAQGFLVAAQLQPGPAFRLSGERQLFRVRDFISDTRHRSYAVSPDGRYFYFINVLPTRPSQIVLITNWIEELKEKLRASN
ncbi:MAG TPA: protein kinase [Gemmatimonadaceae bacterium]|nr:protein kinase [Gemmatimonadaceae bacterium]